MEYAHSHLCEQLQAGRVGQHTCSLSYGTRKKYQPATATLVSVLTGLPGGLHLCYNCFPPRRSSMGIEQGRCGG